MHRPWRTRVAATALAGVSLGAGPALQEAQGPPVRPTGPTVFLDLVALDADDRQVRDLEPADLRVVIDGEPRSVVSVRHVYRGTGAEAAARADAVARRLPVAAETSRVIVVAVDENSFGRDLEKTIVSTVGRVSDVLASVDRVALVTLPAVANVTAETDRQPFRTALASVRGRALADDPGRMAADVRPADENVRAPVLRPGEAGDEPRGEPEPTSERTQVPPDRPTEDASLNVATSPRSSVEAFVRLVQGLGALPGPKTVIYVWGGTWGSDPASAGRDRDTARDVERLADAAAASRVVIHAVQVARTRRARIDATLERLALDTGGTVTLASSRGLASGRLIAAMAGSCLVELDEGSGDRNGRVHTVDISIARPGVTLIAPRRWVVRDDPVPSSITPEPPPSTASAPDTPRGAVEPAPTYDAELETVVARASEYVDAYLRDLSSVVVEEEYTQTAVRRPSFRLDGKRETVSLRSDLLLIRASDGFDWIPFRDVFEVNGKPVRDRDDRLRKLFLEQPDTAFAEGQRITRESSRYNVGLAERTVNTPTLALFFLLPEHRPRLRLGRGKEDTVEGVRAWRVDFEEVLGPALIREGRTGDDLFSAGTFWIEPTTGRVVRTFVRCRSASFQDDLTVTYRRSETLGTWAPAEMKESYSTRAKDYTVTGVARYSKFRRFQVTTAEQVTVPKD